uniref:Armadillo repeat-containing domain-containing protein n=1 Tax=Denticeps clupeoides TaxID=299321 RepID=A0AAY4CBV3_9TELE
CVLNSDLQLAALRLLTNMSVTDKHQHLLKSSITLFLSLLVVANEALQIQVLKVLVNLSSNPDMMEDIVQSQVPFHHLLIISTTVNGVKTSSPESSLRFTLSRTKLYIEKP